MSVEVKCVRSVNAPLGESVWMDWREDTEGIRGKGGVMRAKRVSGNNRSPRLFFVLPKLARGG